MPRAHSRIPHPLPWIMVLVAIGIGATLAAGWLSHRRDRAQEAQAQTQVVLRQLGSAEDDLRAVAPKLSRAELRRVAPAIIHHNIVLARGHVRHLATLTDSADVRGLARNLDLADSAISGRVLARGFGPADAPVAGRRPGDTAALVARLRTAGARVKVYAGRIDRSETARADQIEQQSIAGLALLMTFAFGATIVVLLLSRRAMMQATEAHARELRDLAEHDPLTGLPNRRRLTADAEALLRIATFADPVQVLVLDLDGFKAYNDDHGHTEGDELLTGIAATLAGLAPGRARAYRLGGDEFCVLASEVGPGFEDDLAAAVAATAVRGSVTASVGAVLVPNERPDLSSAMRLADERMYDTKSGRAAVR